MSARACVCCTSIVVIQCILVYYFMRMYGCVSVLVLYCVFVIVLHYVRCLERIWICAIQILFSLIDGATLAG